MQTRVISHAIIMSGIVAGSLLVSAVSSQAADSSGNAFRARFDQGAEATGVAGVAVASGEGPQAYQKVRKQRSFQQSLLIRSGRLPLPEMSVNLSDVTDTAKSPGSGVDTLSSEGDSMIGSASVLFTSYQCPACAGPVINLLSVQASSISASARYFFVAPSSATYAGSTKLGSVTLSGMLIGDKTVTYGGGSPAPNMILYKDGKTEDSSTVVVTLNRQQRAGTVGFCGGGPSSSCPFTPSNIATTAIQIRLRGAMIAGTPVTGDIDIGWTSAE